MYQGKYQNTQAPQGRPAPQRRPSKKSKKRSPTMGTLVFYGFYIALILIFFITMGFVINALDDWLVDFESSQPEVMGQQLFDELFADPDWAELYTLAGEQDTAFEGKDAYAAYMEDKVGSTELTYVKTSGGLSGQKYIVRAGEEKIATYTLTSEVGSALEWELGQVELFYQRELDVTVVVDPGCTVTINGVALDESYIQRTVSTTAEEYLPEGIHGYRIAELYVDDLLAIPKVAATNASGEAVELAYNADTRTFSQGIPASPAITDLEYDTLLSAAKTYCEYMIGAATKSDLRRCFDSSTKVYETITTNDTWMQSYKGYAFGKESISDFYRYSDALYSARVSIPLNVTRKDGSIKEYQLNNTFMMEQQDGVWKVVEMTNVNIQEQTAMIRLTYMNGDTLVSTEMVDAGINLLKPPAVTVPEGKVFSGWFTESVAEDGSMTMSLAFLPGEDGTVSLPSDSVLEPMTLYALFNAEEG